MGGEWNTGATLVAESWPTEFRAKAISIVQSSWALGFAAAALVAGPVARYYGWRAVFFVGILPAVDHVVDSAERAGVGNVARNGCHLRQRSAETQNLPAMESAETITFLR